MLERQEAAARLVDARAVHLEVLYRLVDLARTRGQAGRWVLRLVESEFQLKPTL